MGKKPAGQSSYPEGAPIFAELVRVDKKGTAVPFLTLFLRACKKSPILKIPLHPALSISLSLCLYPYIW
jgi:hypothetical protein